MIVMYQEDEAVQFTCLDDLIDSGLPRLTAVMARASKPPSVSMKLTEAGMWVIRIAFPENDDATTYLTEARLVFTDQGEMNLVQAWLRRVEVACLRAGLVGVAPADLVTLLERHGVLVQSIDAGAIRQWVCAVEVLEALGCFPGARSLCRERIIIGLIQELHDRSPPMQTVCLVLARWDTSLRERAVSDVDLALLRVSLREDLFDERSGPVNDTGEEEYNPLGI